MFKFKVDREIYLKLLSEDQAEDLLELIDANSDYLKEWIGWVERMKTLEEVQGFINNSRRQFASGKSIITGIWFAGKLVGIIGLQKIDKVNKKAAMGYWLDYSCQGKGIITRSTTALVDYALTKMELNKVEIHCAEGNRKSRAIPEKLNFKEEGLLRDAEWLYDHYVDHVIYGLLAREWRERKAE
ncbi:MAG: GNAT family protein [Halanaerobium sp.]|nr:GNAT family protein [Halanaerobium sp.]